MVSKPIFREITLDLDGLELAVDLKEEIAKRFKQSFENYVTQGNQQKHMKAIDKLVDIIDEECQKTGKAFREIEAQIDAICKHFNILLWKNSGYEVREFKRPDEVK